MCSLEQQQPQQGRRYSNSRLSLTVTPPFPILISSDIVVKESANIQVSRSRSSSILVAEELSPESQSKVFGTDSLLWDRLSLISSTESVTSVASEYADREKCSQPVDQENACLQLSDWLIHSMEERRWRDLTNGMDFSEEADPGLYLRHSSSANANGNEGDLTAAALCLATSTDAIQLEDYRRAEGNSVFYANSQRAGQPVDCSQMPSTSSRVYEVADTSAPGSPHSSSSGTSIRAKPSPQMRPKRRRSEGDGGGQCLGTAAGEGSSSIRQLLAAMANSDDFQQNSLKRAELLQTFNPEAPPFPQTVQHRRWKPPRKKFIFELQKANDFLTQLALQKHRCAGCGLKLDRVYAKRAQFCHYFSKLFCQCCHQGAKARIPARILHEWSFKEFPVCDIARAFLSENEDQPVFNVRLINPGLYSKARNLRHFRKLRLKIAHMWPFVQLCRLAAELTTEHGILRTVFTSVPRRFLALECIDVFSLVDFERIANRNLLELLQPLAQMGAAHIEACLFCRQHGHFCQLCMDSSDLLFPFQLDRCLRCEGCGSLAHKKCVKSASSGTSANGFAPVCEKCERIRRKKLRLLQRGASLDRSGADSE